METDLVGPSLTPHFNQRFEAEASGYSSDQSAQVVKPKKRADKRKHKSRAQYITSSSSSSEDSDQSMQVQKSFNPKGAFSSQQGKSNPGSVQFREVDMSDLPSQYIEDIETFRQILKLPDPRDSMPRSSTTGWFLNEVAGQQELTILIRCEAEMTHLQPHLELGVGNLGTPPFGHLLCSSLS